MKLLEQFKLLNYTHTSQAISHCWSTSTLKFTAAFGVQLILEALKPPPPCLAGAFTLHWGYQFKFNNMLNSKVQYPISQIGQMPGSTEVLDRPTGLLTECTLKLCPLATYDSNVLNEQGYPMLVSFERSPPGL